MSSNLHHSNLTGIHFRQKCTWACQYVFPSENHRMRWQDHRRAFVRENARAAVIGDDGTMFRRVWQLQWSHSHQACNRKPTQFHLEHQHLSTKPNCLVSIRTPLKLCHFYMTKCNFHAWADPSQIWASQPASTNQSCIIIFESAIIRLIKSIQHHNLRVCNHTCHQILNIKGCAS